MIDSNGENSNSDKYLSSKLSFLCISVVVIFVVVGDD